MRVFRYLRVWLDRLFADEESVFLLLLLCGSLLVVLYLGAMLTPLFAALILSFLLQGLVGLLMRLSWPRNMAVNLTFVIFLVVVSVILLLFIPLIGRQLNSLINTLPDIVGQIQSMLNHLPTQYPAMITEDQVQSWVTFLAGQLQQTGQWMVATSLAILPNLFTVIIYLVLVPILVYFLLRDSSSLLSFTRSLLPKKQSLITRVGAEMSYQASNYIRGKAIEIAIVSAVTYVCFLSFGLNYGLILSLLVGVSVLVPFVGAAVVTVPVALVGLLQWGWGAETAWLMVAYGIIQLLDGNVLVPILFSEAVNLHPVSIIVAVLIFGGLWGVWGVFFAIPLASLVKAVYQAWPMPHDEAANLEKITDSDVTP